MQAHIYIGKEKIGETFFRVVDDSMGGIEGELVPGINYEKYKENIQILTQTKGIANVEDYNFRVVLQNGSELEPVGGIGITDFRELDEIIIESAGNTIETMIAIENKNVM